VRHTFEELAQQLVNAGHVLYAQGMVPATSGNFSARVGPEAIAITVSGTHKGRLDTSDIMAIDNQGNSIDGRRSSAETALHTQIYRHLPEAGAVLHHHSPRATLLSQLAGDRIILSGYELLKAFPGIDTHEATVQVPVFNNDQDIPRLADTVDNYMQSNGDLFGYLIRGHGLYTWADTVERALNHIEAFEFLFRCELMKRGVNQDGISDNLS
jgi:methylthioribulose-1-phosphate dehydratase